MKIQIFCEHLAKSSAAKKLAGKKIVARGKPFPPVEVWQYHYNLSKAHKCTENCEEKALDFEKAMT